MSRDREHGPQRGATLNGQAPAPDPLTLRGTFAALRRRDELALIPYQTAGFPTLAASLENLRTLAECGADVLELGIPFSDPIADGPTIQYASQIAVDNGVRLNDVLAALGDLTLPCPLVMMSYLNPLLAYGRDRLLTDLQAAGVTGLIVPDLSLEEADGWLPSAREHNVSIIFLLAPTSTDERIRQAAERADGFVYAVSVTGTTGARKELDTRLPQFLNRIRMISEPVGGSDAAERVPVVVGFGISAPEHVRALRGQADGVVVASRIIDAIRQGEPWTELVAALKAATR
jgi:tryptophan synthase alpha subunit